MTRGHRFPVYSIAQCTRRTFLPSRSTTSALVAFSCTPHSGGQSPLFRVESRAWPWTLSSGSSAGRPGMGTARQAHSTPPTVHKYRRLAIATPPAVRPLPVLGGHPDGAGDQVSGPGVQVQMLSPIPGHVLQRGVEDGGDIDTELLG